MKQPGFSLMEMMIVLLIMSIIAAATAPIVSKKMSKGSNSSPWVFIDTKGNAAFNMGGNNVTAVIGASKVPDNVKTRLYIDCGSSSDSQLTFGSGGEVMQVTADPAGRVGISSANIPSNSVAFGGNQTISGSNTVTIGQNSSTGGAGATTVGASSLASSTSSTALGNSAAATGNGSFAGGNYSTASGRNSISIGSDSKASGTWSVAIGGTDVYTGAGGKVTQATGSHNVAIGTGAQTESNSTVAIGDGANATGANGIAIGTSPKASAGLSIAVGQNAQATAINSVAVGSCSDSTNYTRATQRGAVAIGYNARAIHEQSYAIGNGAKTTESGQIVLGNRDYTVYIPGNLVVGKVAYLGQDNVMAFTHIRYRTRDRNNSHFGTIECNSGGGRTNMITGAVDQQTSFSDRRLKNVGEKYTDGLEALKKLDFYHYTFKKDETRTPHVGVIAQDLQKVFPDAVSKNEAGFLTIRMEDMFYAVINAVKELDTKIVAIIEDISKIKSKIEAQDETIKELQNQNAELVKAIQELKQ